MPIWKQFRGNLRKSLQDLINMTGPGQSGRKITALEITELSFHDRHRWRDNGVADAEYDQVLGGTHESIPHESLLDLFARAFTNLHQNSDTKSLRLRLAAREGKPSADLFLCVAHGLHESRILIESMTLHLDQEQWAQELFILGCDRLTTILEANNLSDSLNGLEELSLHFAPTEDCIQWQNKHSTAAESCYGMETDWYTIILTLLELCPALRELRLYGYKAWGAAQISLLDQIVQRFPDLELGVVSLEGFGTADGELSRFMRHYSNTLYKVNVGAVMLTREEVEDLFHIVQTELSEIEEVRFDNLEIVGPKDSALLHSRRYFQREASISTGPLPFDPSARFGKRIILVCFEEDDRFIDDEDNPHSFHRHKDWKDMAEQIAWWTSTPREGIHHELDSCFYEWQSLVNKRYGGFWP